MGESWLTEANCAGLDPDVFVPASAGTRSEPPLPAAVAEVCLGCVVQHECLLDALATGQVGYWAGTTTEQRLRMRRSVTPRRKRCPECNDWFAPAVGQQRYCTLGCYGQAKRERERERMRRRRAVG